MTERRCPNTSDWKVVGGYREGDAVPGLPNGLWDTPQRGSEQSILVTDPLYGHQRPLVVVNRDEPRGVIFAVGEVSNGVYLFVGPA